MDCMAVFDHKQDAHVTYDPHFINTLHIPPQLLFRMYPELAPHGFFDDLDMDAPNVGDPDMAVDGPDVAGDDGAVPYVAESSVDSSITH